MFYNDIISYNEPNIIYSGTLVVSVPGLSNPIIISPITIIIDPVDDYSNFTTVAITSYEVTGTGIITIETTDINAQAISQSSIIVIRPSGEIAIEPI